MSAPFAIYLLHFSMRDGSARHYVGLTTPHRLMRRLDEHAAGNGAAFTRAMLATGATFIVAKLWPTNDPHLERTIKRASHYRRHCPICSGCICDLPPLTPMTHRATFPLGASTTPPPLYW